MILPLLLATAEAASPRALDAGTTVQITELSRKDGFWRFRREIVGQLCTVVEPGLVRHRGRWYAGELSCADGQTYYFFQVDVEVGDYGDQIADLLAAARVAPPELDPTPLPPAPADLAPDARPVPATAPDIAPEWPVGARGRIRAISPADATYARQRGLTGLTCTVQDAPLARSGDGWLSGSLRCGGEDEFFFQVALDPVDGGTPTGPSRKADGRLVEATVPAGRLVRVVDLSASDLYYGERASLVGKTCSVVEGPLMPTGDGWYAGRLFCGEGAERQFYQVAVAPK